MKTTNDAESLTTGKAIRFVVLIGVVSLFADATYEGARSIAGPFLAILGATGTVVGVVAGLGELIGYGLRLLSGYISDRTGKYWLVTFLGYVVNLLAVPLLALAGRWEVAAALMITERIGKAIRVPSRDAMLSHAASKMGRGWAFGVHEALDQTGAVAGPLLVALVLSTRKSYSLAFAWLLIPALLALTFLTTARLQYPRPGDFESASPKVQADGYPKAFWIYVIAAALIAAGYADFPLIAYHMKHASFVSDRSIPLIYALAMGVDAVAALVFGRLFDRKGMYVLIIASLISSAFAPFAFAIRIPFAITGMILWGIGMGVQESILRAAVSHMIAPQKRASAFGVFNAFYGIAWFLGSALMGFLYDISLQSLIAFSIISQLLGTALLFRIRRVGAEK